MYAKLRTALLVLPAVCWMAACHAESLDAHSVRIGLNYPQTGPYAKEGLDQWRAAHLAVDEINAAGGILGRKVRIVWRDTKSDVGVAVENVRELVEKEDVAMIFGGASSAVAVAVGKECQKRGILFFATLSYSTETTGVDGHRHMFRECSDSWMSAKALSYYLVERFPKKRYAYVTADYTWGHTTEASMRRFTGTTNTLDHMRVLVPFPVATDEDLRAALAKAGDRRPDLLVLVLFGQQMVSAVRMVEGMASVSSAQVVVPNLTLSMADGAGPVAMEGIMGTVPWCWRVPYEYDYQRGREFVEAFVRYYDRYPCTSGASAYTILYEYAAAAERTKSFEAGRIIRDLEGKNHSFLVIDPSLGHEYTLLKDEQVWRAFDHQSLQTVFVVRCKPAADVARDRFGLDYFDIIGSLSGEKVAITRAEWLATRQAARVPAALESLANEVAESPARP